MAIYTVTNEAPGARGVGDFLIDAGATIDGVELDDASAAVLGAIDGVTVIGGADKPRRGRPPKGDDGEVDASE